MYLFDYGAYRESVLLDELHRRVRRVVWPWRLYKSPMVYAHHNLSSFRDEIIVEVFLGKTGKVMHYIKVEIPEEPISDEELIHRMADGFEWSFRTFGRIEPEDNIILGEY